MNAVAHLLALNATEGFLQVVVGTVPEGLRGSGSVSGPESLVESGNSLESPIALESRNSLEIRNHELESPLDPKTQLKSGNRLESRNTQQVRVGAGPCCDKTVDSAVADMGKKHKSGRKTSSPLKCAQEWRLPSQGAELLAPTLHDIMARLALIPEQLTHIACVTGPGSFTGIRLTTTSAGGLAMATGAVMGGIPYLPLLAHNARALLGPLLPSGGVLWVVTHARRDLVHAQSFCYDPLCCGSLMAQGACRPRSEILVVGLNELVSLVSAGEGPAVLLGSGITRNRSLLEERFASASCSPVFLPETFDVPQASVLFEAACSVSYGEDELMPEYVRVSDAEESLADIAVKLGLDAGDVLAAYAAFQKG